MSSDSWLSFFRWILYFGTVFVAIGTIGVSFFSGMVERAKEKKIDDLLRGNSILQGKIDRYQDENKRLKENIEQERLKTFDMGGGDGAGGGIMVRSRQGAINEHYGKALEDYRNGNLVSAKERLELILKKSPNEGPTLNLLGVILNEMGNPRAGLECLEKAYQLNNDEMIKNNIELIKQYPGQKIPTAEM